MAVYPTKRITVSDFKSNLTKTVTRVDSEAERFILTCRNKEVAVIISVKDLELLTFIEDHIHREQSREALNAAYEEFVEEWSATKSDSPLQPTEAK